MSIKIRSAETMDDCYRIAELEGQIWQSDGTTPSLLMSIKHGHGTMLMAFDGDDEERLVGFCYSFISFDERSGSREFQHYSFVLGIDEAYRDKNIGYQMKMAQRDILLEQGIELMRWTFDPLETRNANLNLSKLRAVCNSYHESYYGMHEDALNGGIDTDRFMVDWWVDSAWVGSPADLPKNRVEWLAQDAVIINPTVKRVDAYPRPNDAVAPLKGRFLMIEVPDDMQGLKAADLTLAKRWRKHTRRLFKEAFAEGYTAISLIREAGRCYYVLEKDWMKK